MNLHTLLRDHATSTRPVRAGLIGAGKFGSMFLAQARLTEGLDVVGVADLRVTRGLDALARTGWSSDIVVQACSIGALNDAARGGKVGVTDSASDLIDADLDVVVECTGQPEAGTTHALRAIDNGRHVVMVTVEADVLVGPLIRERAERAGVVYGMAYGDQPALICELVDWARTCGFEVAAAGKGTKYLPEYHESTPDTVFGFYGFTDEQVRSGDFNAQMFNSFLDGTKSAIEMAAVANATGLTPQPDGLQFPPVGIDALAESLKPRKDGGLLVHSGTVEVVSCLERDGSPVERDLRWGVYVTFRGATDYVRRCFHDYGVPTDSSGEYATLYRTSHFIGLELGVSVAAAALREEPTGTSRELVGDVASCAKRDLVVGESLDGEGGYTVYGKLLPIRDSLEAGTLPIGLSGGAKVVKPVSCGALLTYDDVVLPANSNVALLRRELEGSTRKRLGI